MRPWPCVRARASQSCCSFRAVPRQRPSSRSPRPAANGWPTSSERRRCPGKTAGGVSFVKPLACGYDFIIGVSTGAHRLALITRDSSFNIVVTGCQRCLPKAPSFSIFLHLRLRVPTAARSRQSTVWNERCPDCALNGQ
ncbi:DUF6310 domain-containing protein [Corallococcus sp. AS-1-12]|uniref:DUF6310 domain-containing protein n=1 Tax=Corallococcus sp. AS-1-12 TaxID=2874598 RepID=UPI00351D0729